MQDGACAKVIECSIDENDENLFPTGAFVMVARSTGPTYVCFASLDRILGWRRIL
jgi:hypothetical protein